jgi:NAD(P)-dependent dehydrogenase (short-subunit alcohol dehydrogenase family)
MTDKKVVTVIGVGPGLGAALARRFAAQYAVALVARSEDGLRARSQRSGRDFTSCLCRRE